MECINKTNLRRIKEFSERVINPSFNCVSAQSAATEARRCGVRSRGSQWFACSHRAEFTKSSLD
jgi:hypothetical protein